ncbi:alkaline phosphatase family protein [Nitriliruptoraceae bacterium ZYF776]|nr:alkaline phosphatase family protein [Profundirhabdus halotolerans]
MPTPPRYGAASVAELVPDLVASLTGRPTTTPVALPEATRGVVLLVIDGLGRHLLDHHAEVAPFLTAASGVTLDAPFPTTTATSLATIGTGRPPGEHGLTGYSFAVPGHDRRLVALTWSWDRQDLDIDARLDVVPEGFQPAPTAFERAAEAGVTPVTVLRPEFTTSGLTRAALRGGEVVPAADLDTTLAAAVAAADRPGRTLVYAHHGDLDTWGHLTGPGSDRWCDELARIDAALARVAADLPAGVAVLVTADHGMVAVGDDGFVELADLPELARGVRLLTGDARARQLHVRPGARDEVVAAWREHVGDRAHVLTGEEAVAAGWFGPVVTDTARTTIGDVVVSAVAHDVAWVHRDVDPFGGRLPGLHGALTDVEREVPALVLTRG